MDLGGLLPTIIGAIGGAAATGMGSVVRTRTTERTAARLVYAELVRNCAPVPFCRTIYRTTRSWPVTGAATEVWAAQSETLARARDARLFQTVHQAYAALDALAFIARAEDLDHNDADVYIDGNVGYLERALDVLGERAQIPRDDIDTDQQLLRTPVPPPEEPRDHHPFRVPPPSWQVQVFLAQRAAGQTPGSSLQADPVVRATQGELRGHDGDLDRGGDRPGAAREARPTATAGVVLRVFDAKHTKQVDLSRLQPVRSPTTPPSPDQTVEETYRAMESTSEFYATVLGPHSLDWAKGRLDAIVHVGRKFNNAYWNGSALIIGDGDGVMFGRFSSSIDVIAHSLTMGLVEAAAGLVYSNQSGALLESIADTFGAVVKQWTLNQTADKADWLIGADTFNPGTAGEALRSMKAPGSAYDNPQLGKDPQPDHMRGYVTLPDTGEDDNGGVHLNCGIPNRAFYLVATGIGGHSWEAPLRIWYASLQESSSTTDFQQFADLTFRTAGRLYGIGDPRQTAVGVAWSTVGITVTPREAAAPAPAT